MSINLTVGTNAPILLNTLTDLENAVESNLSLGSEFASHLDRPISSLPPGVDNTAIQYASGNLIWKPGDFTFTLSGGMTGKLSVIASGSLFSYTDGFATEVSTGLTTSTGASPAKSISVPADTAFVRIELDCSIQGGISGNFTSGIYGVSDSANTSDTFSVACYKRCAPADLLKDAIAAAFSDFVLPLHSRTLTNLKAGDYLHYNFNASLQLGLGASIGIDKVLYAGQYKADIPGTANAVVVNASVKSEVQAGAKLAFSFGYTGSFESLLWKDSATSGHLHLYRSDMQDTNLGVDLGLTLTSDPAASASVMTSQLGSFLSGLLPAPLRSAFNNSVWTRASSEIAKYVADANNRVSGWLKPLKQSQATLGVAIQKTSQKFLLMDYTFDLAAPAFAFGWNAVIDGKLVDALETPNGGISIAIGSGFENFYAEKTSVSLNLFGKLTAQWSSAIIANSSLIYAGNNIFHLITNEGRELLSQVNNGKREIDLYFAAELDLTVNTQSLETANLHCFLRATNNPAFGGYIAKFLGLTTTGSDNAALVKSVAALAARANTTQSLHLVFAPSAYGRLGFSAIPRHPGDDTTSDRKNYAAFVLACRQLLATPPSNFSYSGQSSYQQWSNWNIASVNDWPAPDGAVPDRSRSFINLNSAVANEELNEAFPGQIAQTFGYAFKAASDFMNLCAALKHLSGAEAAVNPRDWNSFVTSLKSIIGNDVSPDFISPTVLALTRLCAASLADSVVGPVQGLPDQSSIMVTMTYS